MVKKSILTNEIMPKSEVWAFIGIFFGSVSYSVFMFYLLAKRSKGINIFDDLYTVNRNILYFLFILLFILMKLINKFIKEQNNFVINLINIISALSIGVLLAVGFFTIVLG